MIAAGVIGGVFVVCTLVMFLGVKEKDGESKRSCQPLRLINNSNVFKAQQHSSQLHQNRCTMTTVVPGL